MKIYRALSKKEINSLLNNNDILLEHKTVYKKDWLMFEHEEDYSTGKYFFFTIEDTCVFIRYSDDYKLDDTIIEMEVDDKDAYRYLGFGAYYYGDHDLNGEWNGNTRHIIPELFLPYSLINEKIINKEYRLITSKDRKGIHITFPYNKNRTKSFLELADVIYNIFSKKLHIEYLNKRIKEFPNSELVPGILKELKENEEKLEYYRGKLPLSYKKFALEHSLYECPVKDKSKSIR